MINIEGKNNMINIKGNGCVSLVKGKRNTIIIDECKLYKKKCGKIFIPEEIEQILSMGRKKDFNIVIFTKGKKLVDTHLGQVTMGALIGSALVEAVDFIILKIYGTNTEKKN